MIIGIAIACALGAACAKVKDTDSVAVKAAGAVPQLQSTEQFKKLVEGSDKKLLVFDLYADWCGPCRILSPTLEQIAAEQGNKVSFYKINVDRFPDISRLFGVRGIPLVVFVKNHESKYALMGLQPKSAYVNAINTYGGGPGDSLAAVKK